MLREQLIDLSASAAVQAMRRGEITAEDYARALLNRSLELGSLRVFRTLDAGLLIESARERDLARIRGESCGKLHGLPVPIKDSINTVALPTSHGTRALVAFVPKRNATVVSSLLAEGGIVMGKTNLHEISGGWTSNNEAFGPICNPYDIDHVPGGSSGGSAAAVAARMAPLAIAADTFGSIRVPATFCGVAGLRPSFGRYPNDGVMTLTVDKLDQVGSLARRVEDLSLFDEAITGEAPLPRRAARSLRIGVSPQYFLSDLELDVERITLDAIERLRAEGVTVVTTEVPGIVQESLPIISTLIAYESRISIAAYLEEQGTGIAFERLVEQLSPNIRRLFEKPPPARDAYEAALGKRDELRAAVTEYFTANALDALAFPSSRIVAPPLGDNLEVEIRGERLSLFQAVGRNIALGSIASLASLVLPAGLCQKGLPIGLELAACSGHDRELLAAGLTLQTALGEIPKPQPMR